MLLLRSGDVELNPGPTKEVLAAVTPLEDKMETGHTEVMVPLNEVKSSQKVLEESVLDANRRLAEVRKKKKKSPCLKPTVLQLGSACS